VTPYPIHTTFRYLYGSGWLLQEVRRQQYVMAGQALVGLQHGVRN